MKITAPTRSLIVSLFFSLFFVYFSSAHVVEASSAVEYYVSKSGSDSNPGTAALPWLTITKAASLALAGDTINVGAGRYSDASANSKRAFNPANSGTPGHPITFKSVPTRAAILVSSDPNRRDIAMAPENRSYITIDGFKVEGRLGATASNNIILQNNEVIYGGPQGNDASLNWGIVLQGTDDSVVRNNYVYDLMGTGNFTHNTAGIMLIAGGRRNLIEHNFVDASAAGGSGGMYGEAVRSAYGQKGGDIIDSTWRRNIAINAPVGFFGIGSTDQTKFSTDNAFFENIIVNAEITAFSLFRNSQRFDIYNNTAYQVGGLLLGSFADTHDHYSEASNNEDISLWNNIVADAESVYERSPRPFFFEWDVLIEETDDNNFFNVDEIAIWRSGSESHETLAEWQAAEPPLDANSFVADPLFVDADNGDFRLQAGSPSKGTGRGGVDIGAYPTGTGIVGPTYSLTEELLGDFDADGDVDGADFLAWQRDTSVGSLSDWQDNFGATASVAASTAVPEPTTAVLFGLAAISLLAGRGRLCRLE